MSPNKTTARCVTSGPSMTPEGNHQMNQRIPCGLKPPKTPPPPPPPPKGPKPTWTPKVEPRKQPRRPKDPKDPFSTTRDFAAVA